MIRNLLLSATVAGLLLSAGTTSANMLANPGFDAGPTGYGAAGWITFGNGFTEANDGFCIIPASGNQLFKMFGTFNPFGVSGVFQEFPTTPGTQWTLSCRSRHCGADPMLGAAGTGNWVVQKLAFFDAGNNEIAPAAVESTVLDGTFAVDTWFNNAAIVGFAPAGCVKVQAFILYLQPGYDGGAAQIDDVVLESYAPIPVSSSTWGQIKSLY